MAAAKPSLAPQVRADLQRVESIYRRFEKEFEKYLLTALGNTGVAGPGTERFKPCARVTDRPPSDLFPAAQVLLLSRAGARPVLRTGALSWPGGWSRKTQAIRAELRELLIHGHGF